MIKTRINWKVAAVSGTLVGVGLGGFAFADGNDPLVLPAGVVLEQPGSVASPDKAVASTRSSSVNAPTPPPVASPASVASVASPASVASVASPASVASVASPASVASVASPASVASVASPASPASALAPAVAPPSPDVADSQNSPASPVSVASIGTS